MNDRQIVTLIAISMAFGLIAIFWWLGNYFPVLRTDIAFATAVPVIVALAVLFPVIRGARK